jgi:hypothetical protein
MSIYKFTLLLYIEMTLAEHMFCYCTHCHHREGGIVGYIAAYLDKICIFEM